MYPFLHSDLVSALSTSFSIAHSVLHFLFPGRYWKKSRKFAGPPLYPLPFGWIGPWDIDSKLPALEELYVCSFFLIWPEREVTQAYGDIDERPKHEQPGLTSLARLKKLRVLYVISPKQNIYYQVLTQLRKIRPRRGGIPLEPGYLAYPPDHDLPEITSNFANLAPSIVKLYTSFCFL